MKENDAQNTEDIVKQSLLFKTIEKERYEILRHKWIESEKRGFDIGKDRAVIDWIMKYRSEWEKNNVQKPAKTGQREAI